MGDMRIHKNGGLWAKLDVAHEISRQISWYLLCLFKENMWLYLLNLFFTQENEVHFLPYTLFTKGVW